MNSFRNFLVRYFCPDLCVGSIAEVDLVLLRQKGYKGAILDLDNTLLGWKSQTFPAGVEQWLKYAEKLGFKMQIVSNSLNRRVSRLSSALGIPFISRAVKPRKKVFVKALQALGSKPEETIVVGDQLFTDVLGGKRMKLFTVLVSPVDKNEFLTTIFLRIPEKILLGYFRRQGLLKHSPNPNPPGSEQDRKTP